MEKKQTTITVSEETWKMLNDRKKLGQTMDDVIKLAILEVPEVGENEY